MTAMGASASEDPDADFAARCASPGVIWCIGFDDQAEVNKIGQTRYPATSGSESIAVDPEAYPNNIAPNGYRYPAVDNTQAASGAGSLRLTANPVASANQSGGWYLGAAGISPWPETFSAGETVYVQYRQRYDIAYTNQVNWGSVGGDGVKNVILWRNEGSCSDLQVVLVDSANRGFPQAYTNCGGNPLYQCPAGNSGDNCRSWNTDYSPMAGHIQYLYQYGASGEKNPEARDGGDDFACMRNRESSETCGFYDNHYDRWWTYYFEIEIGDPNVANSRIKMWLSRGADEPMRQFIDFGPFRWSYEAGRSLQNLVFTLYKTGKSSGDHPVATSWYDELIVSTQPIPAPASVPDLAVANRCANGGVEDAPCPPNALIAE